MLPGVVVGGKLVWFAAYCCLAAIAGLIYFNLLWTSGLLQNNCVGRGARQLAAATFSLPKLA